MFRIRIAGNDYKFIAAVTDAYFIVLFYAVSDGICHGGNCPVTVCMSITVVYLFHAVDVNEHNQRLTAVILTLFNDRNRVADKAESVIKTGHRVFIVKIPELLINQFQTEVYPEFREILFHSLEVLVDTEIILDYVCSVSENNIAVVILFFLQRIEEINMLLSVFLNEPRHACLFIYRIAARLPDSNSDRRVEVCLIASGEHFILFQRCIKEIILVEHQVIIAGEYSVVRRIEIAQILLHFLIVS